jgi:hypothetical protein
MGNFFLGECPILRRCALLRQSLRRASATKSISTAGVSDNSDRLRSYSAAGCSFAVWLLVFDNELVQVTLDAIIRKGTFDSKFLDESYLVGKIWAA